MSPLTETVLLVFGLIGLGYLAGWTRYLSVDVGEGLSKFAVGIAMPLLLFRTMVTADFHGAAPWRLWTVFFASAAVSWFAGHITTTRLFGRDSVAGVVGGVSTSFGNTVLVGIPLMLGVYGQDGVNVLSLIVSIHLPVLTMSSIILFGLFSRQAELQQPASDMLLGFMRKILTNPMIFGIVLGLAWRVTGLPLPHLGERFVDALANIAGPLALFAVGLNLCQFGIVGNLRLTLALSMLKLFLMPAVALLMAWMLSLPPLSAQVSVITAALPAGINSYLIAVQFRTGVAIASSQMTITTAAAAFTCVFWLTIAHMVFG